MDKRLGEDAGSSVGQPAIPSRATAWATAFVGRPKGQASLLSWWGHIILLLPFDYTSTKQNSVRREWLF